MGKKVVIVGGVAGGASAAARLRRLSEDFEIVLFERGADVSFANCGLPYYIGGVIDARKKLLVQTPVSLFKRFNINVRTLSEVTRINPQKKEVEVKNLKTSEVYTESYDYLVINLPNVFSVRNLVDTDRLKSFIETCKPARALVIGGGYVGLEIAENMKEQGVEITVVELMDQIMAPLDFEMASIVHDHLRKNGVNLLLKQSVTALEGDTQVRTARLSTGQELEVDMVVLGIGVTPESGLARDAGLAIGPTGGIVVDEFLRTSDPSIYAVGDAIQVKHFVTGHDALIPLAGPANKQGRIAADNIAGRPATYKGTQGTAIVGTMGIIAATTGVNEKTLKKLGRTDYAVCHMHPEDHARYYPGFSEISLKLIFARGDGRVLGAQIVGRHGVDKRIDVLATAIRGGMTVYDLQELELAYAPPFSSAKDPVNMAGYVAANILKGDYDPCFWDNMAEMLKEDPLLLDVRMDKEAEKFGTIPGSVLIPLNDLRERLAEIPRDKPIMIFCQVGLRGYIAERMMKQLGFKNVKNLCGGYKTYKPLAKMLMPSKSGPVEN
ncbi:MAG: FAD-dependent pyridine nucleotide-disulfide oxidoreductase [Deltaproteobacteria bacterium]|nr:FAD-dependent pyridine nucleotide-disulfide oxidoreductase [Deltaproteobacteria bacterium]